MQNTSYVIKPAGAARGGWVIEIRGEGPVKETWRPSRRAAERFIAERKARR